MSSFSCGGGGVIRAGEVRHTHTAGEVHVAASTTKTTMLTLPPLPSDIAPCACRRHHALWVSVKWRAAPAPIYRAPEQALALIWSMTRPDGEWKEPTGARSGRRPILRARGATREGPLVRNLCPAWRPEVAQTGRGGGCGGRDVRCRGGGRGEGPLPSKVWWKVAKSKREVSPLQGADPL